MIIQQQQQIENLRRNYGAKSLSQADLKANPFLEFEAWFAEAIEAEGIREANAMTLATVDTEGQPSLRIVLLKEFSEEGFVFYTNYNSRKGKELRKNPKAALCFFWPRTERQVRIEGIALPMLREESTNYFQSRPKESQIGALASPQSKVIDNRDILDNNATALRDQYKGVDTLPCPDHWGGFCLEPHAVEFWQGRANRLHDRLRYRLEKGNWLVERLAP